MACSVLTHDGVDRPLGDRFVDDPFDRRADLLVVDLVVQVGDAVLARRVVADRAEEQRRCTARGVGDLVHQSGWIDGLAADRHATSSYRSVLHRIKCMDVHDEPLLDLDEPADIVIMEMPEPDGVSWRTVAVASVISLVLGSLITLALVDRSDVSDRVTSLERRLDTAEAAPPVEVTPTEETGIVAAAAQQAIPSIVTIQRIEPGVGPVGSGSGVVYRTDGYILTNDHVVAGASELKVVFSDGFTYPAELVGTDVLSDVAVLRVDLDGLVPIELADLSAAQIGDLAIAVGNPLGLDGGPSVTSGVISAFDRTLDGNGLGGAQRLYGLLQTDAPITRGSSGGALINGQGQLIGLTTAIGVSDVGAEGLGFAVPVSLLDGIASDLIDNGTVPHAFLGIEGQSAYVVREDGSETPLGAQILRLLDGSAIGNAGAEQGDVIVALDGEQVNSFILLVARLREYRAGDTVTVTLHRGGSDLDIDLVLDRHPRS